MYTYDESVHYIDCCIRVFEWLCLHILQLLQSGSGYQAFVHYYYDNTTKYSCFRSMTMQIIMWILKLLDAECCTVKVLQAGA